MDGEVVWAGGPDDLPEPIREFLQNMIGQKILQASSHDGAEDVLPNEDQLTLGPGDLVVQATEGEDEYAQRVFDVIALVDPSEHAEEFPDWKDRYELRDYVLGTWHVPGNDPMLGWFPRYKLIRLEPWQAERLLKHNEGDTLEYPCVWLTEAFNNCVAGLNKANNKEAPYPMPCGECGKRTLEAHVFTTLHRTFDVGWYEGKTSQDETGFYLVGEHKVDDTLEIELRCLSCQAVHKADLEKEQYYPG